MDIEMELTLLRNLRKKVAAMFEYTGWEDDCDDDAAVAVLAAQAALELIVSAEHILGDK